MEDKEQIIKLLKAELQDNLRILIDPKNKDSLSQARITTWKDLVAERIYYHLYEKNNLQTYK
jgi:hypothetical protein